MSEIETELMLELKQCPRTERLGEKKAHEGHKWTEDKPGGQTYWCLGLDRDVPAPKEDEERSPWLIDHWDEEGL